jgi:hypothetical protein
MTQKPGNPTALEHHDTKDAHQRVKPLKDVGLDVWSRADEMCDLIDSDANPTSHISTCRGAVEPYENCPALVKAGARPGGTVTGCLVVPTAIAETGVFSYLAEGGFGGVWKPERPGDELI